MPAKFGTHKPPWRTSLFAAKREAERKRKLDAIRPPSSRRGYDAEWRELLPRCGT